jgi:leucyl/phenylalanyl-tRNA--protein transferase
MSEPLTPWLLRYGYEQGMFPMSNDDGEVEWYQSNPRAMFPMEGIHVSRSLKRSWHRGEFRVTFDEAFEEVISSCRRPLENWISLEFIRVYTEVHHQGWGHSCEVWMRDQLVGGVYGLAIGGCFCAESMFHRATDASKIALWFLLDRCCELGFVMFDAQIMNPHLRSLGAYNISHREYVSRLEEAKRLDTAWDSWPRLQGERS